ncbi:MAG: substrate-binding domain-containing protein [Cytophaga sp.]|uniref:substrate-binding domain-containing protein n=1 Tax=Cytophaga sp. TaxID=29535 RepID=UPI003F7FCD35
MASVFKYIAYFLFLFLLEASCTSEPKPGKETVEGSSIPDTATVLCDPSWESILRTFIVTYEGLNPHRKIKLLIKPESECIHAVITGSYNTVFVSRNFSPGELNVLKQKQWRVANDTLCYDGLAWIAPKSFPEDSLSVDDVKVLFQTGVLEGVNYTIQLNKTGSSVANYLTDYFGVPPSTSHLYTGGSDEQIIQSVQQHNRSLACISSGWLVNLEDQKHQAYLSSVKVLKISAHANEKSYSPFQNDLALNSYPFKRILRVINNDANDGLGTAFASFLIGNRGQRVFLKAGLLPHKMPAREVELKMK